MTIPLLFDLSPRPVNSGVGAAGLIVTAFIILMVTTAAVVGFGFLVKSLSQSRKIPLLSKIRLSRSTRLMIGDVCLPLDAMPPKSRNVGQDNSRDARIARQVTSFDRLYPNSPNQP